MEHLQSGQLNITASLDGGVMKLVWKGQSAEAHPDTFLNPYLEKLLGEAKSASHKIEMDFTQLEYMNSSTVPPLLRAISSIAKEGLTAEIKYKGDLKWQVASFRALENVVQIQKFATIQIKGV